MCCCFNLCVFACVLCSSPPKKKLVFVNSEILPRQEELAEFQGLKVKLEGDVSGPQVGSASDSCWIGFLF